MLLAKLEDSARFPLSLGKFRTAHVIVVKVSLESKNIEGVGPELVFLGRVFDDIFPFFVV